MPQGIIGATTNVIAEVEATRRAVRAVLQPQDIGALGSYRCAQTSGTLAAGLTAASKVFSWRFNPSPNTGLALVKHVRLSVGNSATAFTAGFVAFNLFVARLFTVDTTTGATQATLTGNNAKLRTSYATSQASQWISTTGAISGDTSTLDTMPIATVSGSEPATAGQPLIVNGFDLWAPLPGEAPLICAFQEGFFIKATVPATGTWQLGVEVQWDEVPSF